MMGVCDDPFFTVAVNLTVTVTRVGDTSHRLMNCRCHVLKRSTIHQIIQLSLVSIFMSLELSSD